MQPPHSVRDLAGSTLVNQQTGFAVNNRVRNSPEPRRDHGRTSNHGLKKSQPLGLEHARWSYEDVRRREISAHLRRVDPSDKGDPSRNPQRLRQRLHIGPILALADNECAQVRHIALQLGNTA